MKFRALIVVMLLALMLCINPTAFAEATEKVSEVEFADFVLYDAEGAESDKLIADSAMTVEVVVENKLLVPHNYCVFAAVYTEDGTMACVDYEKGNFDGNAPVNPEDGTTWARNVKLNVQIPQLTENTELKVLLFESPVILSPEGNFYYIADGSGKYMCSDGNKTALEDSGDVEVWEGIVTRVPYNDFAWVGYDPDDEPEIRIQTENDCIVADCSLVNVHGLLGKKVVACISTQEDEETGNRIVYSIEEKSGANTVVKINSSQFVNEDDRQWEVEDQISYRLPGSPNVYDVAVDDNTVYYLNYNEEMAFNTTASISELLNYDYYGGGTIEFISNDSDSAVEYVIIEAFDDESVIKKVSEHGGYYEFDLYNYGCLDEIDAEDEYFYFEVYKDGEKADVSDITAGDTVSAVMIDRDAVLYYVSSEVQEGSIDAYDESTVTINGKDYGVSVYCGESPSAFRDIEGFFHINVLGQIAYARENKLPNYGMVLAVDYESGITDSYVMQIMMADGTVAEYDVYRSAKLYSYDRYGDYTLLSYYDDETSEQVAQIISGSSRFPAQLQIGNAPNAVFDFEIKDGEIKSINALQGASTDAYLEMNTQEYDAENMRYGNVAFDENTVVFAVERSYQNGSTGILEARDVATGSVIQYFLDGDDCLIFAGRDAEDGICKVVIGFEFYISVAEKSDAIIVTKAVKTTFNGDDAVRVFGLKGGKEVSFVIYNSDHYYLNADPEDLEAGDVILTTMISAEGIAADFELLFDESNAELSWEAFAGVEKDAIYNGAGTLDNAATAISGSRFYIDEDIRSEFGIFARSEDGVEKTTSANYTLVNCTESKKAPKVTKETAETIFDASENYITYVFVRTCENQLKEVVAYRYNENGKNDKEKFIDVITEIDGDYIVTTDAEMTQIGETCIFTDKNGNKVTGSVNVAAKLSAVVGKNTSAILSAYEFTTEDDIITSICEIALSSKISAENCNFNYAECKIGDLVLTGDTSVILLTYSSEGKIIKAEEATADILADKKCDVLYFAENNKLKALTILMEEPPMNYGMVTAVGYESGFSEFYLMEVVTSDGVADEYVLSSNAKLYGYNRYGEYVELANNDRTTAQAVAQSICSNANLDWGYVQLQVGNAMDSVFAFEIKDGEILKINMLEGDLNYNYLDYNSAEYDADSMRYGYALFNKKTVVFALKQDFYNSSRYVESDDVIVGSVGQFFEDGDSDMTFAGLDIGSDEICKVVVGFDFSIKIPESSSAVIVSSVKTMAYQNDEAVEITGVQAGKEVSYILYNSNYDFSNFYPEELGKGDVILVASADEEGVCADFKLLYDASDEALSFVASEGDPYKGVYNAAGLLDRNATKQSGTKFFIDADVENYDDIWAYEEDGIEKTASANYTLVDYTEYVKNPEISAGTADSVISVSSKYETMVFVRVYDDVLSEVVCYRYLEE